MSLTSYRAAPPRVLKTKPIFKEIKGLKRSTKRQYRVVWGDLTPNPLPRQAFYFS
jgi:hypothetical protein